MQHKNKCLQFVFICFCFYFKISNNTVQICYLFFLFSNVQGFQFNIFNMHVIRHCNKPQQTANKLQHTAAHYPFDRDMHFIGFVGVCATRSGGKKSLRTDSLACVRLGRLFLIPQGVFFFIPQREFFIPTKSSLKYG